MDKRRKTYLFWAVIVIVASFIGTHIDNSMVRVGQVAITVYALYRLLSLDHNFNRVRGTKPKRI